MTDHCRCDKVWILTSVSNIVGAYRAALGSERGGWRRSTTGGIPPVEFHRSSVLVAPSGGYIMH